MGNGATKEFHKAIAFPPQIDVIRKMLATEPKLIASVFQLQPVQEFTVFHQKLTPLLLAVACLYFPWNTAAHEKPVPMSLENRKQYFDVINLFLEHPGCDKNAQSSDSGETALHFAAKNVDLPLIKLLLKHKCSSKIRNAFGFTPFQAMCVGAAERYDAIVDCGVEWIHNQSADKVRIPKELAETSKALCDAMIEFFVEADDFPRKDSKEALVNPMDGGNNSVHYLAEGGYFQAIGELVTAGYSVSIPGGYNNTPLVSALREGESSGRFLQTVRVLLENEKFDSEEQKLACRLLYLQTVIQRHPRTCSRTPIEDETKTLLYELLVNQKLPHGPPGEKSRLAQLAIESAWDESEVEKTFGTNGFYGKYIAEYNERQAETTAAATKGEDLI